MVGVIAEAYEFGKARALRRPRFCERLSADMAKNLTQFGRPVHRVVL